MSEFQGYGKIAETSKNWDMTPQLASQFKKNKFCVTEKIHGANFCFVVDANSVQCAKRRQILQDTEDFFHFQQVRARLLVQVQNLFHLLQQKRSTVKCMYLFGELFGGGYPNVASTDATVQLVQTGIYYSPNIEFCAFDLAYMEQDGKQMEYEDYDMVCSMCKQVQILCAEPLFIGTYEKCLEYPLGFNSTIPKLLGLPEVKNNKAEGVGM